LLVPQRNKFAVYGSFVVRTYFPRMSEQVAYWQTRAEPSGSPLTNSHSKGVGAHTLTPCIGLWTSSFEAPVQLVIMKAGRRLGTRLLSREAGLSHTLRVWLRENNVVRPNQKNAAILVLYSEQVVLFNWSSTCVT